MIIFQIHTKETLMKQILIFLFSIFYFPAFAQMGINTEAPKATLDIKAKKEVLSIDGLIPPRLTLEELTAKGDHLYGPEQDGAIIYITNISAGNSQGQREFIQSKGLYIYDATFIGPNEGRWMCIYCIGAV